MPSELPSDENLGAFVRGMLEANEGEPFRLHHDEQGLTIRVDSGGSGMMVTFTAEDIEHVPSPHDLGWVAMMRCRRKLEGATDAE